MERLTNSDKEIPTLVNNAEYWLKVYFKLKDYEDAEEQGLLLRLPCKVGDNIYIIKPYGIEEASITGISEADDIDCFCFEIYIDPDCHEIIALEEFNDTWFLTKEEAEAKLKEMESSYDRE
jgi:hypothetical protein